MIDPSRFEELHIVRKIKEKIRKWWRIELSFADATGYVVDHKKGVVIPPHSRFCEASLGCREGFGRCNRSIEKAVRDLASRFEAADPKQVGLPVNGAGDTKALLVDQCHMGFHIIAAPVVTGDKFHGAIFACGFLGAQAKGARSELIQANAQKEGLTIAAPDEAYASVPSLSVESMDCFQDLLETTVGEIVEVSQAASRQEARIAQLSRELGGRYQFANIIGKSQAMQRLFSVLEKVVDSESTVLVTGENGTGKELIGRALHYNGPRRDRPFVVQNCSALNDNLLESELFGHVKGSFTGAMRDKPGLFRVAHGGTFLLDEVGDMSPAMQVKVLRVIQEGTFLPVGGTKPEQVDVRIIAATNRNLKEMVQRREFREDLYYRLNVLNLEVPPLRARTEDLPMLCDFFLKQHAEKSARPLKQLAPEILARFFEYAWPGNIRELENEVERLVVLAGDRVNIGVDLLPASAAHFAVEESAHARFKEKGDLSSAVSALEREMIQQGLISTHWNKTQLAARLGVSRTTLIKKIKDYGIEEGNGEDGESPA